MFGLKKDCQGCTQLIADLSSRVERLEKQRKADLADYHDLADKVNHWMKRTDQRVRQQQHEQGPSGAAAEGSSDSLIGAPRSVVHRRILTRRGLAAVPRAAED